MNETISEAIGADHRAMDTYIDNLRNAKDLQTKMEWRNQLTWTLARHAISEELILYPAMERTMGQEGTDLTDVDRKQHQEVKEDLYKLQSMSPDDQQFMPLLNHLVEDLHRHIAHECNEDMPRLEKLLSREESQQLAKNFQRTKMITPTRSHPSAPDKPYFENFAVMLAAPIDKFMDLLRAFPDESKL